MVVQTVVVNAVKINYITFSFLLFFLSSSLYAKKKTYYVCNTGNDSWSGLTIAQPLKTIDKAMSRFSFLKKGDAIAFCHGGRFIMTEYKAVFNKNCTASSPCLITDYFSPGSKGDEPVPIIESPNNGVFYFNTRNIEAPDGGVIVENLSLIGGGVGRGVFLLNGFSNVEIRNVVINNFRVGVSVNVNSAKISNAIVLKNSFIINNAEQGWLGGSNNLLIENNVFENNGYLRPNLGHNVYISGEKIDNIIFDNNKLYRASINNDKCSAVSLVVHGNITNLKIRKNVILEGIGKANPNCFGIGIGPGYSTEESFVGLSIEDNVISNIGNVGIGCASCTDVKIVGNIINHEHNSFLEAIKIPVGKEDSLKSARIIIQRNEINMKAGSKSRYKKKGISVFAKDVVITKNQITYNDLSYSCINYNGAKFIGNNECIRE